MDAPTDDRETGFLIGWLDAIWSAFSASAPVSAPEDVQYKLIRRGWVRPREKRVKGQARRITVTPLGAKVVIAENRRCGIERKVYDENERRID